MLGWDSLLASIQFYGTKTASRTGTEAEASNLPDCEIDPGH